VELNALAICTEKLQHECEQPAASSWRIMKIVTTAPGALPNNIRPVIPTTVSWRRALATDFEVCCLRGSQLDSKSYKTWTPHLIFTFGIAFKEQARILLLQSY
jgi:hypothetical protein